MCDVRAKLGLKRACDVRACEAFRGLARCDRNFETLQEHLLSLSRTIIRSYEGAMKFQPSVIPKLHKSVISIELFQVRNIYCCKLKAEQGGNYVEIGPITFNIFILR